MIAEVLAVYGNEVAPSKKSARNYGYNISNLLKWWGEKRVADITKKSCEAYIKTKTEPAAGADLKVLKQAVMYWHGNEDYGPLAAVPIFVLPEPNPPKERWLTREEAARLLRAARHHQHLRRMILLCLYTGSRPGVILAMRWNQIDLKGGLMSRKPPGTREDKKKKAPKVRLGRRILSHLKRWKRLDKGEQLVCHFTDPWHPGSRQVDDPHGAWKKALKAAKLTGTGVTRHTLRHTRATWMMQAGVPIWEAAGFLGMTVKTLERVYGHHSPDHQERAANI
jgi:integrase